MAGPAPVIEGSLKNTIHALAFGLIVTTLAVNFGKFFLPHFFPYMMGVVIFFEAVLFSLDKPKETYDIFQPAGLKGQHTIEGSGSPQITVSAPGEDPEFSSRKQQRIKDKQKGKKDQKGRRGSGIPGSPSSPSKPSPRQSLSVPPSPGMETFDGADEKGKEKSEKEKKKEEEKEKKKEREEEKERQKAEKKDEKERVKEGDEDKSEKGSWRKRLGKKQNSM